MLDLIGTFIVFIVLWRVIAWIAGLFGIETKSYEDIGPLEVRTRRTTETNEENGYTYEAIEVQARGTIPVPCDNCPVQFTIHAFDGLDEEIRPVLSSFEGLQEQDTIAFEWRSDAIALPLYNGLGKWTTMFSIPVEVLVFPRRGNRKLSVQFCVIAADAPPHFQLGFTDGETGQIYAVAQSSQIFENIAEGYEEREKKRRKVHGLIAEMGLHMAAVDGQLDESEAQIVKDWLKRIVNSEHESNREEVKKELLGKTREAYQRAAKGASDLDMIVVEINEIATQQEKYEALELCMDVMAADENADAVEIKELDRIAKALKVDPKTFRNLREQRFAKMTNIHEVSDNLDTMLGITREMTPEQIKGHLSAEYRKWNSRVSHSDEKIRKRASEMLLMIGEARKKHVDAA